MLAVAAVVTTPTNASAQGFFPGGPVVLAPGEDFDFPLTGTFYITSADSGILELSGLGSSGHSLITVTDGSQAPATVDILGGQLEIKDLNGFQLKPGQVITFATAGSNVTFTGNAKSVELTYTPGDLYVDELLLTPYNLSIKGVAIISGKSLLESDPTGIASGFELGTSLATVQSSNIIQRLDSFRAGDSGFSVNGVALEGGDSGFDLAGPTGPSGKEGSTFTALPAQHPWGAYITGLGEFSDVNNGNGLQGYNLRTGGFDAGMDYRVTPNIGVGLTAGYAYTETDLANSGSLVVNGGKFGIYATAFKGGFYVDGALIGGVSSYDTHRVTFGGTASGHTDGQDISTLINTGYDMTKGNLTVGPMVNFQTTQLGIDGFTETGSLVPLKFADETSTSLRSNLGAKASYSFRVGNVVLRPEINAGWQHEYGDDSQTIGASFANGSGGFSTTGAAIGRDSLLLNVGVTVQLSETLTIYAFYDGDLARENYESNNVSVGLRLIF